MEFLQQHIESLIFTANQPITITEISEVLEHTFEMQFRKVEIKEVIDQISEKYQSDQFAFEVIGIANGYQFLSKGAYFNTIATYLKQTTKKKLSGAALETLSIIAYKQPVSKPEMEKIRGVSCDYAVQKLLEKELVTILGRSESVGKPLLYGTSDKFMDYFGLKSLDDLPKPKDFKMPDTSIGEAAPIEEEVPTSTGEKIKLPVHSSGITDIVSDIMGAVLTLDEDAPEAKFLVLPNAVSDEEE